MREVVTQVVRRRCTCVTSAAHARGRHASCAARRPLRCGAMTTTSTPAPVRHPDRLYIGGEWVEPSSDARIDVIDSGTEELYYQVAEAQPVDVARAVAAARTAFDDGPWPTLTHAERAEYLRAFGPAIDARAEAL